MKGLDLCSELLPEEVRADRGDDEDGRPAGRAQDSSYRLVAHELPVLSNEQEEDHADWSAKPADDAGDEE